VVSTGRAYVNERSGTRIEFSEASPERYLWQRTYPPGTGEADAHYHRDFVQDWTVVEGRARVQVDGDDRDLGPGDSLAIELEQTHKDIHNPFDEPLVVDWRLEPCNDFVECFAAAYVWLLERDRLNDQDEFQMLQLFTILAETKGQSYASGIPVALQRPLIPVMAAIGRLRGYKPRYD
jgi:hypothetical protein